MYVIAVTGGIGSGKTLACRHFAERGAIVLSLDDIAHQSIAPGQPAYDRIVERYGPGVLDGSGRIDRGALAALVFEDDAEVQAINRIVHPSVLKEVVEGITSLRLMERPPAVVVIEVPLLAEAPVFADVVDTVLAINAPADVRMRRCAEAGMDPLDASRRIARQATDEERAELARHVIDNSGTVEEFLGKLDAYWEEVAPRGT